VSGVARRTWTNLGRCFGMGRPVAPVRLRAPVACRQPAGALGEADGRVGDVGCVSHKRRAFAPPRCRQPARSGRSRALEPTLAKTGHRGIADTAQRPARDAAIREADVRRTAVPADPRCGSSVSLLECRTGASDPYRSIGSLQSCPMPDPALSRFASTKRPFVASGSRPQAVLLEALQNLLTERLRMTGFRREI